MPIRLLLFTVVSLVVVHGGVKLTVDAFDLPVYDFVVDDGFSAESAIFALTVGTHVSVDVNNEDLA
jgi:hypothetical protein